MSPLVGAIPRVRRGDRRGRPLALLASGLAILAALIVLAPGSAAEGYAPADPVAWTNGLVLCEFAPATPLVSVSSLNITDSGLSASLAAIEEVGPNGSVAAFANLSAAGWAVNNLSTEDAFVLEYAASVPIDSVGPTPPTSQAVSVSLSFELPAYDGSPDGPTDTVSVLLQMGPWAIWQPGDHVRLTFGAAPSFPSAERLSASTASGWIVSTVTNGTGVERERMGANTSALYAGPPGELPTIVPVQPSLALASATWATIAVDFPSEPGASLPGITYSARVGVVVPSTIAGIPLPDLAAVAAAAAAVSVVVALTARRVRARPSRIVYAEDEAQ